MMILKLLTIRLTSRRQLILTRLTINTIHKGSTVHQMKYILHNLVTITPNSTISSSSSSSCSQHQTMTQCRMLRLSNKVWSIVNLRCPIFSLILLQISAIVATLFNQTLKKGYNSDHKMLLALISSSNRSTCSNASSLTMKFSLWNARFQTATVAITCSWPTETVILMIQAHRSTRSWNSLKRKLSYFSV